jgi:hypothetical protein
MEDPHVLRVRDRDDVWEVIPRVESCPQPGVCSTVTVEIGVGGTHRLLSGKHAEVDKKTTSELSA